MSSLPVDSSVKSPRSGPSSVTSRSSRPQQHHRKLNPASGNNTVTSGQSNLTPGGPTSTHTAFAPPQGTHIPTLINEDEMLTNENKPYRVPNSNAEFDDERKSWTATVLPRSIPDKREDVLYLEEWLTSKLSELANSHPVNIDPNEKYTPEAASVSQQQLDVLNKGHFELVRQVSVQCADRGELLLRTWRASHELFENVIRDLSTTVNDMRIAAETWKEKHDQVQKDMDILSWKHSRDLELAMDQSKTHKSEDSTVYRDMQDELFLREKDMNMMEAKLSDLSIWFPNFDKYASSNLRKQLPTATEQLNNIKSCLLPQEYFSHDMERASRLLDTFSDKKVVDAKDEEERDFALDEAKSVEKPDEQKKEADNRFRELIVDNQLQEIVLKESERKMRRMEDMEIIYKKRIDELTRENNSLRRKVSEGDTVTILRDIPCFLKSPCASSVADETGDLYLNKRSADSDVSIVPPSVLSVGDLQASLHKCCSDFLSNKLTLNWCIQKGSTTEGGFDVLSDVSYWRLMGTMGGVNGPEMRVNSFESLLSFFALHHTRNKRMSRESLRRACWSTLLWKNKMGISIEDIPGDKKTVFNHIHSQTSNLPRQLGENEKPFVLCMCRLLGYFREEPDNPLLVNALYFNVFMKAYGTLQRYMKSTNTSASIFSAASNLFVPASPCLIPVEKLNMLLKRLFTSTPQKTKLYRPVEERRYSRAVNLSVTEKFGVFGGKTNSPTRRPWWICLPNSLLHKVYEDITTQGQKYSSALVEAYDIIEVMWKHIFDYYTSVRAILENLYVFLEAITTGPMDPMFTTFLLSFLEIKDSALSTDHKMLSVEIVSLSSQGLLSPTSFADTILSKHTIFLTGLHILFDDNLRVVRELRREGLELLDNFKSNFIRYEADADLSKSNNKENDSFCAMNVKRLTIIGRYNDAEFTTLRNSHVPQLDEDSHLDEESSSYFSSLVEENNSIDSGNKKFDVLLSYAMYCLDEESLDPKDDSALPYYLKSFDIYCANVAMKCVSDIHEVTRITCPVVDIDKMATSIRHRELHLARNCFYAWFDYIEAKKQRADGGDSDDSADDEDHSDEGHHTTLNPVRRVARAMHAFTITESKIEEDDEEGD